MAGKGPRKLRLSTNPTPQALAELHLGDVVYLDGIIYTCLLYTSPSPRDGLLSRMPSSA